MASTILPFKVIIAAWGSRFAVSIEPRQVDKPSHVFRTALEAEAFAEGLGKVEGWPIEDRRS